MNIQLNGKAHTTNATTLAELLIDLELTGKRVAVEVNESLVPKSQHAGTALSEGDQIEVVHAVGGG